MSSSHLFQNELIIHDDSPIPTGADGEELGRGLDLGLRGAADFAYGDVADPFPREMLIPRTEWESRIVEMERTLSRVSDWIRVYQSPCKDQGRTNFCWANAPVRCVEIVRLMQHERPAILSPASVACHITGFRNVGGWGYHALKRIIDHGVNSIVDWPANGIDRRYATPENLAAARGNAVFEWIELKPRTLDQLMSCLLRRIPVAVGFNWWGHEVTAVDPLWIDGAPAIRCENSWGPGYGANGMFVLQGQRMLPDDAVAPRAVRATN